VGWFFIWRYALDSFPLKWHGGKNAFNGKLAKWIISLMPPHVHYVEPYFGGGAVLLHKDPTNISEVVNDLNGDLMNFWRVLATTPDRMLRQLWATPMSEPVFDAAFQDLADQDAVRRATAFFHSSASESPRADERLRYVEP
jgi:DNA adenine methylase